jgi:hypothetical protein
MTPWVHYAADGGPWYAATVYDPPSPGPVGGKGYPLYFVEVDGFTFEFASLHELAACAEVLTRKVLPATYLVEYKGQPFYSNTHWLSRLPAKTKTWRYRERAVRALAQARAAFTRELGHEYARRNGPPANDEPRPNNKQLGG